MTPFDATQIENSHAVGTFGDLLGWVLLGAVVLWFLGKIMRNVEAQIMPSIPIIVAAGFVGLLAMGLLHRFGV